MTFMLVWHQAQACQEAVAWAPEDIEKVPPPLGEDARAVWAKSWLP